jgi:signal transduction histidine kinase
MFSNVRWRIALWFIGLSTAAYVIPSALAMIMFYVSLTGAIDRDLDVFMASFGHAIDVADGKPVLRDWARIVETDPKHSFVAYQLFDRNGNLLETHEPKGIPILIRKGNEVSANGLTMRTKLTALREGSDTIGYLQVQLPTKSRDDAVRELALITLFVAPVVLLGLGWSSYLVSEKATVQIKQTLATLRQFIADASHELYTPLTIVQAANETLSKDANVARWGGSELEISENALERMERMIEDLMLLSTVDVPISAEDRKIVALTPLLENIINQFRPKFELKNVALTYSAITEGVVFGDAAELERVFANLLENSWRYTAPTGKVAVRLSQEKNSIKIEVSDNGVGIPKESLPNIFDRFYRVDSSRSRSSGGAGLGLSIAKAIVQSHSGSIEVTSEPGSGSTFSILLPLK